ncbi:MAG: polysaccharide biosynthesis C-terminal domain-containing protein [Acidobacteriota bacterium]|nr:polysaccharide biosynthesis C-terminal domain-containing protein [Acidobacteriota bacterium]
MDSSTKRRLLLGFASNWVSRLAGTVVQLVQVPVFLHFWSVPLYGEWMVVNSIPSYLSFSNVGFGTVAGNEMTMSVSREDRATALCVFQSCWWLIIGICSAVIALLAVTLYLIPAARLLHLHTIGPSDAKWIIFYLGVSVLLGQLEQLIQSAYRSIGRYAFGSFMKSMLSLAAFTCTILSVILGGTARQTALVYAIANLAVTAFLAVKVRQDIPWLRFGWQYASLAQIRRLVRPAIAFMGFPLGNALNLQGTLLAVSYALGPTAVVVFGTARTVSRVALQMVQMVNNTFEPELAISYGASNLELTRKLHRRACQVALLVAFSIILCMMTVGPWFLHHWSGGHVPPSRGLLSILLLVVVFFSLWSTSSTLLTSTNQHQRLAAYYIFATSLTCVVCYGLSRAIGLYGAALALLLSEAIMNFYVLPASLRVAHDTFPAFLASMRHYPDSLRPAAVLARLRRR